MAVAFFPGDALVADACDLKGGEIEAFEVLEGAAPFGADWWEFQEFHFFSFG